MPKFKCDIFGDFKHSAKCSKEIIFERWASLKLTKCLPEIKSNLQKLPDDWKLPKKKIKITLLKNYQERKLTTNWKLPKPKLLKITRKELKNYQN